jgi:acetyl-CoA carboxylase biotin carboxyl carrier protein
MTPDLPAVNGHQQQANQGESASGMLVDLAQVRKHTVELLTALDRPPHTLRIQAGAVTVDITWSDVGMVAGTGRDDTSDGGGTPTPQATADGAATVYLTSPAVGVFYHAREPGADPFVSVGGFVEPGQQIGVIEAMKLMMPVEADCGGRITAVLKANGEPVEYGEPLFALEAERSEG